MIKACLTAMALVTSAVPILAEPIAPERIVDAVTGDWDKDGLQDMAMIVAPPEGEDNIGLFIYVRSKDHPLLTLVVDAPGKIWGSTSQEGTYGQEPSLQARPNGSIAVISQNSGIGRDRWEQTLTLAYRNGDFVVAGYTYNSYDTLEPDNVVNCDYNVLTGKAKRNEATLKVEPKFVTIQDWSEENDRGPCRPD